MKSIILAGMIVLTVTIAGSISLPVAHAQVIGIDNTKNAVPQLSTTLIISMVYSGGGGSTGTYLNDFVEIKNISSTPQSLNGLSLIYGSASGQFGSGATLIFALPNVTLNPGQYYLVQTSNAGSGGVVLPVTPDSVTTNLSMAAASGKVILATSAFVPNTCGATATPCTLPNPGIIDLVAWGAANNAEGGATVNNGATLTSTQGSVRKTGGCTETDNNNADFDVVTAPVPRNTSSSATPCGAVPAGSAVVDLNGDGKTDFTVVRNVGVGPTGQVRWFTNFNSSATTEAFDWGISTDFFVPEDYDGDNKTDIAVWRPISDSLPSGNAFFYIYESATGTVRVIDFGQEGDDPSVVGDYDGDGKADLAVFREGATSSNQSVWFYRASLNNPSGNISYNPWGVGGDFPAPGDYDGDGKNDFVVQRNNGDGQARFWMLQTTDGFESVVFGTPTDMIVPGDYDGDGKTDVAVVRGIGGQYHWFHIPSSTGINSAAPFAIFGSSSTDFVTQGDYDGDGKTDAAVWRSSATPGLSAFWYQGSTGGVASVPFGAQGDYPVANYNTH